MKKSKKIILLATLLLAINGTGYSQDGGDREQDVRVGLKAGMNYSNVYDERGDDFVADGKVGFAGGVFFSIPIGQFIGIQPEILLSQKGYQATGSVLGMNYEMVRTTTFLDIPVYFALRPAPFLTLLAGPQFSYLLHQKDEFISSLVSYEAEQEFNNDNIRKNILCFAGGFDVNIGHAVVGARAGFDFQDNQGDGTSSTPRYKNTWVQATFGLRF